LQKPLPNFVSHTKKDHETLQGTKFVKYSSNGA